MEQTETVGPINLGNPSEITVKQLAETILRITGSRSTIVYRPLPEDDPRQRCPDIRAAKQYLNWEPKVCLEIGLTRTIEHFRAIVA